jgi:hypothetical protein
MGQWGMAQWAEVRRNPVYGPLHSIHTWGLGAFLKSMNFNHCRHTVLVTDIDSMVRYVTISLLLFILALFVSLLKVLILQYNK